MYTVIRHMGSTFRTVESRIWPDYLHKNHHMVYRSWTPLVKLVDSCSPTYVHVHVCITLQPTTLAATKTNEKYTTQYKCTRMRVYTIHQLSTSWPQMQLLTTTWISVLTCTWIDKSSSTYVSSCLLMHWLDAHAESVRVQTQDGHVGEYGRKCATK